MFKFATFCALCIFMYCANAVLDQKAKYIALQIQGLGLANRFRTMADWHQIAVATDRTLLVSWEATADCNITLDGLIAQGPEFFKLLPFALPHGAAGGHLMAQYAEEQQKSFQIIDRFDSFFLPRHLVDNPTAVLFTNHTGIVALQDVPCQLYLYQRSKFYQSIIPVEALRNQVDHYRDTYFSKGLMVGVHYRVHEPMVDWDVVPNIFDTSKTVPFGTGASMMDYANYMQKIHDRFVVDPFTNKSDVVFFVTSNSLEAKKYFSDTVPNVVSFIAPNDSYRNTTNGMQLAMLEWLLLSHSSLLINPFGSSFANEASYVYSIPLISIWYGNPIVQADSRLPYCGHFQFIREIGQQGVKHEYREGSQTGNRQRDVAGWKILLKDCGSHLRDWGMVDEDMGLVCTVSDEESHKKKNVESATNYNAALGDSDSIYSF